MGGALTQRDSFISREWKSACLPRRHGNHGNIKIGVFILFVNLLSDKYRTNNIIVKVITITRKLSTKEKTNPIIKSKKISSNLFA